MARSTVRRLTPPSCCRSRSREIPSAPSEDPLLSRGTFVVLGTITLLASALVVTIGTSAPILTRFLENPGQVGPAFYNRVNLPLALLTTLYTNPLTIVPLYFAAFTIGRVALGGNGSAFSPPPDWDAGDPVGWLWAMEAWVEGLGAPLALGLVLLASGLAALGYFAVKAAWRWHLIRAWRRRRSGR